MAPTTETEGLARRRVRRGGLACGPVLAILVYLALPDAYLGSAGEPVAFGHAGRATAAVAAWMAVWWLSEAISLYATALLPLVLFPLLGIREIGETTAPYAHELIFLFMGGFLLALTMERWELHRRIALTALLAFGDRPTHMVGGFMLVTALLSMWVSNTATAIMMLPVATGVIDLVARRAGFADAADAARESGSPLHHFALALLLGIAYAASIGGIATPIGTPPNLFLLSFARANLGREISFVAWMGLALPLVIVLLPLTWLLLTRVLHPVGAARIEGSVALVRRALRDLGPLGRGERIAAAGFALAALLWITRPLLTAIEIAGTRPLAGLGDTGIAMLVALLLFVAPVDLRRWRFALDWPTAARLPWGILLLFGGGLSLAAAIQANGVGEFIGARLAALSGLPPWLAVVGIVTLIVFLTELTSNTATTATLVPVLAAAAPALGLDPLVLAVPAAMAASCAFMLPVATPPNAVVFSSGWIDVADMSRAGFWLNWIGITLVTACAGLVVAPLLGS